MRLRRLAPRLVFWLLPLAACSTTPVLTAPEYLSAGNRAMDEGAYDIAVDNFQKLLEEHPFDPATEEAQLKTAHALFLDERYPEAIASFQDFQRMHPTNPSLPFTEFHIALAYQKQVGKKDRDHRAAQNAEVHFRAVLDRYPDSAYADDARTHLQEVRDFLADHELVVARFYLHWKNPLGAEARLRHLLTQYPDTNTSAEALSIFADHFRGRGDVLRCAAAWATLTRQYPQSPHADAARRELETLIAANVEPPEDPLAALIETLGRQPNRDTAAAPAEREPNLPPLDS
jgi:outer membrane protein assembly factor BamD